MSETRKIQKIGNTLYISIPKLWTTDLHLKHGEKITLVPHQDGSISIYPKTEDAHQREITLNITSKSSTQSLKRGIIAAYLDGFDKIELKTETALTEEQHEYIRETINCLFGLELIEVTGNRMVIVCLRHNFGHRNTEHRPNQRLNTKNTRHQKTVLGHKSPTQKRNTISNTIPK